MNNDGLIDQKASVQSNARWKLTDNRTKRRICISSLVVLTSLLGVAQVTNPAPPVPRFDVDWNVPVTPAGGAHLTWYEVKADPEDSRNLIVCGTVRDAQANAFYGVVYSSRDSGKSWKTALEDRNSTWVTEHSCAFGKRHLAYFISEASKVDDSGPHHDLGTTRIFFSANGGETWAETAKTAWADFSTSVVAEGANTGQRLFVFYNGDSLYESNKGGHTVEYFTVSEDGTAVSGRHVVDRMAGMNYGAAYPSSAVSVHDGSIAALFEGSVETHDDRNVYDLGVVRIAPDGSAKFATIARHLGNVLCPASLSNTLAYDTTRNLFYVAYNDASFGRCSLMLSRSTDGGGTWSQPQEIREPDSKTAIMYFPVLSIQNDGLLGLLWKSRPDRSPGCWNFSTLSAGIHLAETLNLSTCPEKESLGVESSAFLRTVIQEPKTDDAIPVTVLTVRDYLFRAGVAATSNGVFHPVWSAVGNGSGELRTAAIASSQDGASPHAALVTYRPLEDVTNRISVSYGGGQRIDKETNSLLLDILLRNRSSEAVHGPLYLKVENLESEFGRLEVVGAKSNDASGDPYLDLSACIFDGALKPNGTSSACHLRLRFADEKVDSGVKWFLAEMKLRFFMTSEH